MSRAGGIRMADAPSAASTDGGLERAIGYRVHEMGSSSPSRLAWLVYGAEDGRIETLMVRPAGWRGLFARHERSIPASRVRAVDHSGRGILLSPSTGAWR